MSRDDVFFAYAQVVAMQTCVLLPMYVSAAVTRAPMLFLACTTASVLTSTLRRAWLDAAMARVRARSDARSDAAKEARSAATSAATTAWTLTGLLSAALAVASIAFTGMMGLVVCTFVAFALSLVLGAGIRVSATARGEGGGATPLRVALHVWEFALIATFVSLALVVLLAPPDTARQSQSGIVAMVGLTPLASLLDFTL